jgi:hypothetical protein
MESLEVNLECSGNKRKRKCIRPWKEMKKLVLGEDMGMEEVKPSMEKALTWKFVGKHAKEESLRRRMEIHWYKDLGYIPIFHT